MSPKTNEIFYERFLDKIQEFRDKELYCDLTIIVGDASFKVHKEVVAANCDKIKALINEHQNGSRGKIQLDDIKPNIFKIILDIMYGLRVTKLTNENVNDVLKAARNLNVDIAIKECLIYYEQNLNISNCIIVLNAAMLFGSAKLAQSAATLLCDNFKHITEFSKLRLDSLQLILASNFIDIEDEAQVLDAVLKWVMSDDKQRTVHLDELLPNIRLSLIKDKTIEAYNSNPGWSGIVARVRKAKKLISGEQVKARLNLNHQQCMFAFVFDGNQDNTVVQKYSFHDDTWTTISCMPEERNMFAVVALDKYIYVVGGQRTWNRSLRTVIRYDVLADEWLDDVADMNECRSSPNAVVLDGKIYALGGSTNSMTTNSVEVYDPKLNTWSFCANSNTRADGAAACVLNNTIYLAGGSHNKIYEDRVANTKYVDRYKPETDKWERVADLTRYKVHPSSFVYDGKFYLIGGTWVDSQNNVGVVFDPYTGQWSDWNEVFRDDRPLRAGMVVFDDKLYCCGGFRYNSDGVPNSRHQELEVYNFKTQEWTKKSPPNNTQDLLLLVHSRV